MVERFSIPLSSKVVWSSIEVPSKKRFITLKFTPYLAEILFFSAIIYSSGCAKKVAVSSVRDFTKTCIYYESFICYFNIFLKLYKNNLIKLKIQNLKFFKL